MIVNNAQAMRTMELSEMVLDRFRSFCRCCGQFVQAGMMPEAASPHIDTERVFLAVCIID